MPPSETTIVWFRQDLRLADHPAFTAAVRRGKPVLPVFIWSPEEEGAWAPGSASRWWLHHSLKSLDASLRQLGLRLILRAGPASQELPRLAHEVHASAVFWHRRYEPAILARDLSIQENLSRAGLAVEDFNGSLLHEPCAIKNKTGKPFQVFTPFWRNCLGQAEPDAPLATPQAPLAPRSWPASVPLPSLALEPRLNWSAGFQPMWQPGEAGARHNLDHFVDGRFPAYDDARNRPDQSGTSRLSPHLHFGEITPRQIWHALQARAAAQGWPSARWRNSQFLAEIGWREFAHHLLFHFPHTPTAPLREAFTRFPWREDPAGLKAWQQGNTGFPIVDAGMRELWATGWMHNRVRMIAASFLVKDLLISWTEGARWFWDTLVDADLASNTLGWQWTAGCGADAAPYFRIFNPSSQGEKFDPNGDYVRQWVPELKALPTRWIHRPEAAPATVLAQAGVQLGRSYPKPIVSHAIAREVALEAFQKTKSA
jgi:deoxyribodipyrimidine photo-lyase